MSGTSASRESRRRFISAGWDLLDEVGLPEALGAISVPEVAERAGRSERTFWNHFDTWDTYVEALVSNIPRRGPMQEPEGLYGAVQAIDDSLVASSRQVLPLIAREAAGANWDEVTQPDDLKAFRRQLLIASRANDDNLLNEVLGRDYYGAYLPLLQHMYEGLCAQTHQEPIEPFDFAGFTRILAALSEGLLLQHIAEPGRTTRTFVTNATAAVAFGLLSAKENPTTLQDIEARTGTVAAPLDPRPEMDEWARKCMPLCRNRDRPVSWSEIASATNAPQIETRLIYQRRSVLGAVVFGQFIEEADLAPLSEVNRDDQATSRTALDSSAMNAQLLMAVTNLLCGIARIARTHRWCARSLLSERLGSGDDRAVVQSLVPAGALLANLLEETPRSIHERMINVTVAAALSDDSATPAEIAHCAIELHPELRRIAQDPETL